MGLVHFDSFDYYATAQLAQRYDVVNIGFGIGGVAAGKGRRGSQGLYFPHNIGGTLTKYLGLLRKEIIVGCALSFPNNTNFDVAAGAGAFFRALGRNRFNEVITQTQLAALPDGALRAITTGSAGGGGGANDPIVAWSSDPGVIRFGQGYRYFEWRIKAVFDPKHNRWDLGECEVRVDEEVLVDNIDIVTQDLGTPGYSGVQLRVPGNVLADDFYVSVKDEIGGTGEFRFLGDVHALALYPNGVGDATEWVPDAASLAAGRENYATVDEHPPDDGDYVTSSTTGAVDRYAFDDTGLDAGTEIFAVAVDLRAAKLDAGPRRVGPSVNSGGVVFENSGSAVGDAPAVYQTILETDPNGGGAWTVAAVDALLAGPRLP